MNPFVSITRIEIETLSQNGSMLTVVVQNVGHVPVGPGSLVVKRVSKDHSIEMAELCCPVGLAAEEKTKLRQLLPGSVKEMEFISYDLWDVAVSVPIIGLRSWWNSPWSLPAA